MLAVAWWRRLRESLHTQTIHRYWGIPPLHRNLFIYFCHEGIFFLPRNLAGHYPFPPSPRGGVLVAKVNKKVVIQCKPRNFFMKNYQVNFTRDIFKPYCRQCSPKVYICILNLQFFISLYQYFTRDIFKPYCRQYTPKLYIYRLNL